MKRKIEGLPCSWAMVCIIALAGCGQGSSRSSANRMKQPVTQEMSARGIHSHEGPLIFRIDHDPSVALTESSVLKNRPELTTRVLNNRLSIDGVLTFRSDAEIVASRLILKNLRSNDRLVRVITQFAQDPERSEAVYDRDLDAFYIPMTKVVQSESSELRLRNVENRSSKQRRAVDVTLEFASGKSENWPLDFEVSLPLQPLNVARLSSISSLTLAQIQQQVHQSQFAGLSERWSNVSSESIRVRFTPEVTVTLTSVLGRNRFVQDSSGPSREVMQYGFGRARLQLAGVSVRLGDANAWLPIMPSEEGGFEVTLSGKQSVDVLFWLRVRAGDQCSFPSNESVKVIGIARWTGRYEEDYKTESSRVMGYQFDGAIANTVRLLRLDENLVFGQSMRSDLLGGVGEPLKGEALPCQGVY